MQIIEANGRLFGKVTDVLFSVGQNGVTLVAEKKDGAVEYIPWSNIQAASDFILLRSTQNQTAPESQKTPPTCPTCSKPLTWIPQYQRWYCYNDKKYV